MLESLHVKNYVLIDNLDLDFSNGFTAITGETGSGKSIMLGALSLLLGKKADKDDVRLGFESAEISGIFSIKHERARKWLDDHSIELEDGTILVRRVIKENGRSIYTINGSSITRSEGEDLGALLVDISSQHAKQFLSKSDVLRQMVDEASMSSGVLNEYLTCFQKYKNKLKEQEELDSFLKKSNEEADYIRFCLDELEKADLKIGEEDDLKERLAVMTSSEFLAQTVSDIQTELKTAGSSLDESLSLMHKAEKKDAKLLDYATRLENISIECDDIKQSLRDYMDSISFSEYELEEKNERLATIQKIKRRFGPSIEDALKLKDEYKKKLDKFENGEELQKEIKREVETLEIKCNELANRLSGLRKKGAKKLAHEIEQNLHSLGMKAASMEILIEDSGALQQFGKDKISFMIAANKGEKFSEIQNSSSGGELSRLMLALKVALKGKGDIETLLFDEIDSGIGGTVANNVALELLKLSKMQQVVAITHLAQIASKADRHFVVFKEEKNGRTISHIKEIKGEERVKEIARLLSGDTSEISLEHARSLLEVQN